MVEKRRPDTSLLTVPMQLPAWLRVAPARRPAGHSRMKAARNARTQFDTISGTRRHVPATRTYLCRNCRTDRSLLPGHGNACGACAAHGRALRQLRVKRRIHYEAGGARAQQQQQHPSLMVPRKIKKKQVKTNGEKHYIRTKVGRGVRPEN